MDFVHLLHGIFVGFSLAAPMGPLGVLCIRKTLGGDSWHAFLVGLSAALADVIFALIAAFGVSLVFTFITRYQSTLQLAGGIILVVVGLYTFRSGSRDKTPTESSNGDTRLFISSFILALTNPMTLFAFAAAFSGLGVQSLAGSMTSAALLIAGVFLGSILWFLLLIGAAHVFREKISARGLSIIKHSAGALLVAFGVAAVAVGLYGILVR